MTGERPERPGIRIPREVADAAALPEDLDADATAVYEIPDTSRRRRAGAVHLLGAALVAVAVRAGLPPAMWGTTVLPLALIGGYHLLAGWRLRVRDREALEIANRTVGFPVGHAAASVGFRGWRARPVWQVLVFDVADPPRRRGLVQVDGVDGHVRGRYAEEVPAPGAE